MFGEQLQAAVQQRGPLCVGIDPHPGLLRDWGLDDSVQGLRTFSFTCAEAFRDIVAMVKPQVALYERFGSAGFAVLEDTLELLRGHTLVLADAKRGDIGSTTAGYADAWLGPVSPLSADAVTASPFLGVHSLDPLFEAAEAYGKGVFVLAATSNPEGRGLQDSLGAQGVRVSQQVVDECAKLNAGHTYGNVGVVVGATCTHPPVLDALNGPVLLPGVGAQGATIEDARRIAGSAAVPTVSRSILRAGPDPEALREAVRSEQAHLG